MNNIDIATSHKTAIGCSKIAQALGMSRWGTAYELWAQLTGRQPWPNLGNHLRVALGEPMEDVLRPFVAERLGGTLTRDRREYRHPDLPLVGHVDFRLSRDARAVAELLGGPGTKRAVVDTKTSLGHGARHRFGDDGTDEVDADVLLQMQGYLLLTKADAAFVAALVPGPDLKIYPIQADAELQDLIREGVARFWNCVQSDTPPEPTTEAEARQRWVRHEAGRLLELDADGAALLRQVDPDAGGRRRGDVSGRQSCHLPLQQGQHPRRLARPGRPVDRGPRRGDPRRLAGGLHQERARPACAAAEQGPGGFSIMNSQNSAPSSALAVITDKLAARFDLGDAAGTELMQTLRQTAFRGQVTDAQLTALLVVANQYGLNPWTKEIHAFPDRQNGIVPVVGVDGWARIINEHPQFDGMSFEQDGESCTCTIFRKDRAHPVTVTEYLSECRRSTPPWQSHPRRMLRHKAMIQCARLAFGFAGIVDPDTAEAIVERDMGQAEVVKPASRTASVKERLAARLGKTASDPGPVEAEWEEVLPETATLATAVDLVEQLRGLPVARVQAAIQRRFGDRFTEDASIDLGALPDDVAEWVEQQLPRWLKAMKQEEEQPATPPPATEADSGGGVDGAGDDWGDGFGGDGQGVTG